MDFAFHKIFFSWFTFSRNILSDFVLLWENEYNRPIIGKSCFHFWLTCFVLQKNNGNLRNSIASCKVYCATLVSAFNFAPAFLHIFPIWSSKISFQSTLMPNSFWHLLLFIRPVPLFTYTISSVLSNTWHLSSLPFIWLLLNQLNRRLVDCSNDFVTDYIFTIDVWCCVICITGYVHIFK